MVGSVTPASLILNPHVTKASGSALPVSANEPTPWERAKPVKWELGQCSANVQAVSLRGPLVRNTKLTLSWEVGQHLDSNGVLRVTSCCVCAHVCSSGILEPRASKLSKTLPLSYKSDMCLSFMVLQQLSGCCLHLATSHSPLKDKLTKVCRQLLLC